MPNFRVNNIGATIEQYRISFNRNTIVFDDHFIRDGHL